MYTFSLVAIFDDRFDAEMLTKQDLIPTKYISASGSSYIRSGCFLCQILYVFTNKSECICPFSGTHRSIMLFEDTTVTCLNYLKSIKPIQNNKKNKYLLGKRNKKEIKV
jgi:hypothetical protein